MTTTYTNNGDGTGTLSMAYTADTTKVLDVGLGVAHALYVKGFEVPTQPVADPEFPGGTEPVPWADLTNDQKLVMVDKYVKQVLLDMAKSDYQTEAVITARDTADAEAATLYDLG